jgi:hypothetical protein
MRCIISGWKHTAATFAGFVNACSIFYQRVLLHWRYVGQPDGNISRLDEQGPKLQPRLHLQEPAVDVPRGEQKHVKC